PDDVAALAGLAEAREQLGDRAGAIEAWRRAAELAPPGAGDRNLGELGRALLAAGETAEAHLVLAQAAESDDLEVAIAALAHLAELDRRAGRGSAAAERLAIAIERLAAGGGPRAPVLDDRVAHLALDRAGLLDDLGRIDEATAERERAAGLAQGAGARAAVAAAHLAAAEASGEPAAIARWLDTSL